MQKELTWWETILWLVTGAVGWQVISFVIKGVF